MSKYGAAFHFPRMPETPPTKVHEQARDDAVVFIVSRLPPAVCGVGDYTMRLIEHLRLATPPTMLVMEGAEATRAAVPGLPVEQITADRAALLSRLRELGAACVVLQYVGYGFHWRCCPLWLLRALGEWRRSVRGARLVVMAHELWVRCAWWKPDWIIQQVHRRALRRLAAVADQVFTSTEGYRASLADVVPAGRLRVLPIGSNIVPVAAPETAAREPGSWVLFGRQGSRVNALRTMAPWLAKLHAAGHIRSLTVAGSSQGDAFAAEEKCLLASALPADAIQILGPLPPADLSRLFLRTQFGIFAQTPASFTKSGIFMAYASHGLAIVADNAAGLTGEPHRRVLHPSDLLGGKAGAEAVRERGAHLLEWYGTTADWESIAAAYRTAIQNPEPQ